MDPSTALPRPRSVPTLTEQTYEIILAAILSLRLGPGTRLSVQRLSEELGVSRTPVKDAFLRLEQDGLVSILPKKGTFVSDITLEYADEILESRMVIESYAAGKAATDLSPDKIAQAEDVLQRMIQASSQGQAIEAQEFGEAFHGILLNTMGNQRLSGFMEQMDRGYARIRLYVPGMTGRDRRDIDSHRAILEAIKAGDAAQATAEMNQHMASMREKVMSLLAARSTNTGPGVGKRKGSWR